MSEEPAVLTAWVSGEAAKQMEAASDDDVIKTCVATLKQFLGDANIPQPIRLLRSRWYNERYIHGAYCYIGLHNSVNDIIKLAEPVLSEDNIPRLLFAGEATSMSGYSTMHGAYMSAVREANRVLSFYTAQK